MFHLYQQAILVTGSRPPPQKKTIAKRFISTKDWDLQCNGLWLRSVPTTARRLSFVNVELHEPSNNPLYKTLQHHALSYWQVPWVEGVCFNRLEKTYQVIHSCWCFLLFHSFVVVLGVSLSIHAANIPRHTPHTSCICPWQAQCDDCLMLHPMGDNLATFQAPFSLSITMSLHQRWRSLKRPQISHRNGLENGGS